MALGAVVLTILTSGFNPYITNTIDHCNPIYPLGIGDKETEYLNDGAQPQFLQKKKLTVNVNGKNYDVVGEIGLSHTAIDITGSDVKIGDVASVEISPLMVNPNIPRVFE